MKIITEAHGTDYIAYLGTLNIIEIHGDEELELSDLSKGDIHAFGPDEISAVRNLCDKIKQLDQATQDFIVKGWV